MFGVAGSSTLAVPKPSGFSSPGAAESAESIAGDPASRWKSAAAAKRGFACRPCCSWVGLAARNAASEV